MSRTSPWIVVGLLLASCGAADHRPPEPTRDGATESATPDAQVMDANTPDANEIDANTPDANEIDASTTDASTSAVSCDRRDLQCRVADPACPAGQVPEIINNCFGACVPIDQCVCSGPADCPHEEMYTCHNFRKRCGPYL